MNETRYTRCLKVEMSHDPSFHLNIKADTFKLIVNRANFVLEADSNTDPVLQLIYFESYSPVFLTNSLFNQYKSSTLGLTLSSKCLIGIQSNCSPESLNRYALKVELNL